MRELLIVANFFVQFHDIEEGRHTYTLRATQLGKQYSISYTGEKLPVDDGKKFYARVVATCIEVASQSEIPEMTERTQFCELKSISYQ